MRTVLGGAALFPSLVMCVSDGVREYCDCGVDVSSCVNVK